MSEPTNALDRALAAIDSLPSRQDLLSEVKRLRAIEAWALAEQPIKAGDRVAIGDGYALAECHPDGSRHGWWGYHEVLIPGAPGTAVSVDYSPYSKGWVVAYRPDVEWTTGGGTHEHRFLSSDPERHLFRFHMDDLVPASTDAVAPTYPGFCAHGCSMPTWLSGGSEAASA